MPRRLSLVLAVLTCAAALSCEDPGTGDPCGTPEYGGAASDEAWLSMLDGEKRATADDTTAAGITFPAQGDVLSAALAAAVTAAPLGAGTGIALSITSAYLRNNRIVEGPYKPTSPRTFTVAP